MQEYSADASDSCHESAELAEAIVSVSRSKARLGLQLRKQSGDLAGIDGTPGPAWHHQGKSCASSAVTRTAAAFMTTTSRRAPGSPAKMAAQDGCVGFRVAARPGHPAGPPPVRRLPASTRAHLRLRSSDYLADQRRAGDRELVHAAAMHHKGCTGLQPGQSGRDHRHQRVVSKPPSPASRGARGVRHGAQYVEDGTHAQRPPDGHDSLHSRMQRGRGKKGKTLGSQRRQRLIPGV